jgi:uncharacterized coiled-coil DUF342 family protein
MCIFNELAEVEGYLNEIKDKQDRVLDMFEPKNEQINTLLKELVLLQTQFEELENELLELSKNP